MPPSGSGRYWRGWHPYLRGPGSSSPPISRGWAKMGCGTSKRDLNVPTLSSEGYPFHRPRTHPHQHPRLPTNDGSYLIFMVDTRLTQYPKVIYTNNRQCRYYVVNNLLPYLSSTNSISLSMFLNRYLIFN